MIMNSNMENENSTSGQGISREDMPLGFSFSLAMHEDAMTSFAKMNDVEKRQVLEAARNVQSKQEMERFVESIGKLS